MACLKDLHGNVLHQTKLRLLMTGKNAKSVEETVEKIALLNGERSSNAGVLSKLIDGLGSVSQRIKLKLKGNGGLSRRREASLSEILEESGERNGTA